MESSTIDPISGHSRPLAPGRLNTAVAIAMALLIVSLLVAPFTSVAVDVRWFWLHWAEVTGGTRPWQMYSPGVGCNYPPFVTYLLTAAEGIRRLLGMGQQGRGMLVLIKLPNILAHVAGVWVCAIGLRPLIGARRATATAILYAICPPLFINAAIWAQYDALLSLAMIGAVLAVLNDRPILAGVATGLALSMKLQAVVLLPTLVVYGWRQWGWITVLKAAGAAFLALVIVAIPDLLGGGGKGVWASYFNAVDLYKRLSFNTYGPWQLLQQYNLHVRHLPYDIASNDHRGLFGPFTPKRIGLAAFFAYLLFLTIGLYRRPTRFNFVLASGLLAFGFYVLPTQIHQRYSIPAVAILTLIALCGAGRLYLVILIPATINQATSVMYLNWKWKHGMLLDLPNPGYDASLVIFSAITLITFAWMLWLYYHHVVTGSASTLDDPLSGPRGFAVLVPG